MQTYAARARALISAKLIVTPHSTAPYHHKEHRAQGSQAKAAYKQNKRARRAATYIVQDLCVAAAARLCFAKQ